LGTICHDQRE